MPSKEAMIEWLANNIPKTGNTTAGTIRNFYQHQTETDARIDYERELTKQQAAHAEGRRKLDSDPSLVQAQQAAAKAQAEAAQGLRDYRRMVLCQHNFNGKCLANIKGNWDFIEGWALGDTPTPAWLQSILDQDPKARKQLVWQEYISPSAEKQHNAQVEASTRATFHTLARDYDLSRCESNVQAILGHFPDGADAFTIGTALQNQELNLAPCNKAEHLEYTKELEAEYARKWKSLPLHEMRKRSQECNSEREALLARHFWKERGVLTKQDEHEARQQSIKTQESTLGFPPMPEFLGETKLDAAYLRGCSRNQLMDAVRRFGAFQVNQRLVQS